MKDTKTLIEHLFTQQGLPAPQSEEDIYQLKIVPHLMSILADLCEASGVYQKEEEYYLLSKTSKGGISGSKDKINTEILSRIF